MTEPEFQVFVIGGSRAPEDWARVLGYLNRNHIEIIPVDKENIPTHSPIAHEYLDISEEAEQAHRPIWIGQTVYTWVGEQLGCQRQIVTQSWHILEKLELKLKHPEAVKDLLLGPGSSDLPIKFHHRQSESEERHEEMVVDVWSLKRLVEIAKVNMRIRGKVALWEYLGLTQVGDGTMTCWDKITTSILSRLTSEE